MTQPDVRVRVQDFGPIAEAAIDLRPLTVFVGPSNTGKTYLATLVYALHRVSHGVLVGSVARATCRPPEAAWCRATA